MLTKKKTYDRAAVGARLKGRRKAQGVSRAFIAEKIGIVEKYYADIERGTCGMSVETLMALADYHRISLDELIYGERIYDPEEQKRSLAELMEKMSPKELGCCKEMLEIFVRRMKETD